MWLAFLDTILSLRLLLQRISGKRRRCGLCKKSSKGSSAEPGLRECGLFKNFSSQNMQQLCVAPSPCRGMRSARLWSSSRPRFPCRARELGTLSTASTRALTLKRCWRILTITRLKTGPRSFREWFIIQESDTRQTPRTRSLPSTVSHRS